MASEPKEFMLLLSNKSAGVELIKRRAARTASEGWEVDGLMLPVPGSWQVELDVLISDVEKATVSRSVHTAARHPGELG